MKRKLFVLALGISVFVLLGYSFGLGQCPQNPGALDTLWLERIETVNANSQVVYRIYLFNDHSLQGFQIPFTFPDTTSDMDISLDSISWEGTRGATATTGFKSETRSATDSMDVINKNRLMVWAVWLSGYLTPVTRANAFTTPLVKAYFKTGPNWVSQSVPVDTTESSSSGMDYTDSCGYSTPVPVVFKGALDVTDITTPNLPTVFSLSQNYPNPFNPSTTIRFDLADNGPVSIIIFNILGQKVRALVNNEYLEAGPKQVIWDGKDEKGIEVASGIYFCRMNADKFSAVRKMTLMK